MDVVSLWSGYGVAYFVDVVYTWSVDVVSLVEWVWCSLIYVCGKPSGMGVVVPNLWMWYT